MDTFQEFILTTAKPNNYFGSSNNKDKRYATSYDTTLRLLKSLSQRRLRYQSNLVISFVKYLEEDNKAYNDDYQNFIRKLDDIYYAHKFPYCQDSDNSNRMHDIIQYMQENSFLIHKICSNRIFLTQRPTLPQQVSITLSNNSKSEEIVLSKYRFYDNKEKDIELLKGIADAYHEHDLCNDDLFVSTMYCSDYLRKIREKIYSSNIIDNSRFLEPVNLHDASFSFVESLYEEIQDCYNAFMQHRPKTYRPKTETGKTAKDNWLKTKSIWTDSMVANSAKLLELYSILSYILNCISNYYALLEQFTEPSHVTKCKHINLSPNFNAALCEIFNDLKSIFNKNKIMIAMCFFFFDKEILSHINSIELNTTDYYKKLYPDYVLHSIEMDNLPF